MASDTSSQNGEPVEFDLSNVRAAASLLFPGALALA